MYQKYSTYLEYPNVQFWALFLIMISDIDEIVKHSILSSFADNTRLMKSITTAADIVLLQENLGSVYEWTREGLPN